jgi:hypothetical protein
LLAAFIEKPLPAEAEEGLAPGAEAERKRFARGPIHEAIHAYLTEWLINRQPEHLLPLFSVKAYPCIAEFGGDSRPDSRMALLHILKRLQDRNRSVGEIKRLEDVVQAVSYPLPDAVPVRHSHEALFSIQEVHDDVAWAIDCRVRYNLQMPESIPRPPHRLDKTYVVSLRIKDPEEPQAFLVQTWKQESGEWRLVSFDLKRKTMTPPQNLFSEASSSLASHPDAGQVSNEASKLLTSWLIRKQKIEAVKFFLPEAAACDPFAETHATATKATAPGDTKTLFSFLDQVASHALPDDRLEGVIAPVEAGHHELRPLAHDHAGAFLLAEIAGDLLRMSACGVDPASSEPRTSVSAPGKATLFRLVQAGGEEGAAITLYWRKSPDGWRVASYLVTVD